MVIIIIITMATTGTNTKITIEVMDIIHMALVDTIAITIAMDIMRLMHLEDLLLVVFLVLHSPIPTIILKKSVEFIPTN